MGSEEREEIERRNKANEFLGRPREPVSDAERMGDAAKKWHEAVSGSGGGGGGSNGGCLSLMLIGLAMLTSAAFGLMALAGYCFVSRMPSAAFRAVSVLAAPPTAPPATPGPSFGDDLHSFWGWKGVTVLFVLAAFAVIAGFVVAFKRNRSETGESGNLMSSSSGAPGAPGHCD